MQDDGLTPLWLALERGADEVVLALLACGANVNASLAVRNVPVVVVGWV